MFGLPLRWSAAGQCALPGAKKLLVLVVLWSLMLGDNGRCIAMLEVEPSEVLVRLQSSAVQQDSERQEPGEQSTASVNISSAVVKEARFSCLEVESDLSRRRPKNEVIWMKDGEIIITKGNRKYRNYGKKKWLLISDLQAEDSGIYECATSPNSTEKGRAELWIVPQVLSAPSEQTLHAWAGVGVVECQVSNGTQVIEWWLEGRQVAVLNLTTQGEGGGGGENGNPAATERGSSTQQDSRYSILYNGSLVLSLVSGADEGMYRCVAANKAGNHFKEIKVTVNGSSAHRSDDTKTIPTSPSRREDNLTEEQGEDSSPSSSTDNRDCIEYEDISFGANPISPTLPPPPPTASASPNSVGRANTTAQSLYFTAVPPSCVQSLTGYRIVLNCSAGSASPQQPNITWLKDGDMLQLSRADVLESHNMHQPHYVQMTDGSLLINPVQFEDQGKYVCRVSGGEGPGAAEITTEVKLRVTKMEEVCGRQSHVTGSGSGSSVEVEEGRRRRRRKRVADGEVVANADEWPWQALIEYRDSESLCGGTLIRPDWIVTAAHCLYNTRRGWVREQDLIVRMGVYNRSTTEHHQQTLQVRHYLKHPDYFPHDITSSKDYDVALLKLLHPVKLTGHVGPACLPPEYNDPPAGTLCTVTGWGHLEYQGESPYLLHKAQVPLVSHSTCRSPQSYGRSTNTITRNMLCAGWRDGGQDACHNDSGGPLVCPISSETPERWALYGVVNWGEKCGLPHKYGVYARITKYMRWINQKVKLH